MDSNTEKKFDVWIRRQIYLESEEKGQVKHFLIKHIQNNKPGPEVATCKVRSNPSPDDISPMMMEIENCCISDAEGLGDLQKYQITPFFEKSGSGQTRFILTFQGTNPDNEMMLSESPDASGLAVQAMRHVEALMRINVNTPAMVIQQLQRLVSSQGAQIEKHDEHRLATYALIENLTQKKHERDMDLRHQEFKDRNMQEIVDKVILLLPAAVNKISGKNILPEKVTPEGMMVRELMKSFSPEQMESLQKVLKPEQQMLLFQFYQKMQDEEERSKKDAEDKKIVEAKKIKDIENGTS